MCPSKLEKLFYVLKKSEKEELFFMCLNKLENLICVPILLDNTLFLCVSEKMKKYFFFFVTKKNGKIIICMCLNKLENYLFPICPNNLEFFMCPNVIGKYLIFYMSQ